MTYLPLTGGDHLYLATVIDICSRRLIGWSIAGRLRAELVCDALRAAVRARGGDVDGVVFHSDRGRNTPRLISPRPVSLTVCGGRWAGSAPATTTL
ncbi:DDE-type integrase/transposase/recombinase [Saccharopolyspora sp. NPDC050389]|uniref:DDE-type integrase/transposase/recombinase n=1 Tax=Saccharopolyspora sp. NPDC050389 TaxID=3155516 RepID=UPI00340368E2